MPDRSVRDDLVHDHARAVAEDVRDLAHRRHVVLDHAELAERDRRVGGVRAVDREHPRVVGEARSDPAHARERALVGPLLALLGPADVEVGRELGEVGEVLLAPVDRVGQERVAGQREPRPARELAARAPLVGQRAPRVVDQAAELAARLRGGVLRARHGDPHRGRAVAVDLDVVTELPARAAAEGTVVALARHRLGPLLGRALAAGAEGAVVAGSGLAVQRVAVGADDRRVGVVGRLAREPPGVTEHEAPPVEGAAILRVVARVRDRAGEAPRVLRHQLGVRVDHHLDGLLVPRGVRQLEADQGAPPAVGGDVGALEPQPAHRRQVVADVALPARELPRRADPLLVDAEVDGVEQLQRGRDDAAHLARDVPAVGVEAPVLEPEHLGSRARGDLAPVLQPLAHRQL